MDSRSSAAHRARSRVNAAAKASARSREACAYATDAACWACLRRLYHVDRETPSASHGCFAGRLGPMPCALRQRSERKRAFSRRSASVIVDPYPYVLAVWTLYGPKKRFDPRHHRRFCHTLSARRHFDLRHGRKVGYFDAPLLGIMAKCRTWCHTTRSAIGCCRSSP
jgi:hypothetical protein